MREVQPAEESSRPVDQGSWAGACPATDGLLRFERGVFVRAASNLRASIDMVAATR